MYAIASLKIFHHFFHAFNYYLVKITNLFLGFQDFLGFFF